MGAKWDRESVLLRMVTGRLSTHCGPSRDGADRLNEERLAAFCCQTSAA